MIPWKIPRMWEGGECWIIGGGPSMPHQFGVPEDVISAVLHKEQPLSAYSPYLSPIHNKHVIGINVAFLLGSWIDITFFGDAGFYFANKQEMDSLTKLKVSCNPNLPKKDPADLDDIKYVPVDNRHQRGITTRERCVSWNLNSGAAAIGLAYHLGVKRVYLLGYDMELSEAGLQHWHSHYIKKKVLELKPLQKTPFRRHLPCFKQVANDAHRLGLEIINVNPVSKIEVFKRVKLSDVL